jgi:hypothetical protein
MSDIAIRVENLSKAYQIAHASARASYRTLREELMSLLTSPLRRRRSVGAPNPASETFWALNDVSF